MNLHYQIPRSALLWVLAALVVVIAPHVPRIPVWISLLTLACMVWRLLIFSGRAAYPGKFLKTLIVMLAFALTMLQFRADGPGLDSAVYMLILGVVFKLLEMQYKRDIVLVIVLAYVLTMVGFIYSQSIPASFHALLAVIIITGALIALNRENARNNVRDNAGLALLLLVQSLPLMLVLFVFVPRIAPLWTMPLPAPSAKTGVTDEMRPGDISALGRSGDIAFRVGFDGEVPSHERLYWRGLVLDFFDGMSWRRAGASFSSFAMVSRFPTEFRGVRQGERVDYEVILEATQQSWVYALQLAEFSAGDIIQDRNYTLHTEKPVTQRLRYDVSSYLDHRTDLQLSGTVRARSLQLPEADTNLRSKELARRLRAMSGSDREYAGRVLRYFAEQPFYYTLNPPLLGEDSIDDFLFSTLQGFCEHYAGSFVYLMRAAGLPARVVVGYQGGEHNPYENYTMVYQYNAHAWAEVWFEGEGWVQFDPTAAVAPDRIRLGVEAVFANQPGFMEDSRFSMMRFRDTQWLNSLRLRLDAVDYAWNRWVISYDEDMQLAMLERLLGEKSQSRLLIALAVSAVVLFSVVAFFVLRGGRGAARDPATRIYLQLASGLARAGIARRRGEGPLDYCTRVSLQRPDLAPQMQRVTRLYMELGYEEPLQAINQEAHDGRLRELRAVSRSLMRRVLPWPGVTGIARFRNTG